MKKLLFTIALLVSFISFGQTKILTEKDLMNALIVHNQERHLLGIKKLEWSNDLQKDAENYAKYLARTETFEHSKGNNQGENLYYEYISKSITDKPFQRASIGWLVEKKDYEYARIGDRKNANKMIGHYTQMIWKETTKVGMGAYVNKNGKIYVVARYYPSGNWDGEFPY
tara:strand:- start:70 stop:579 length:510 start_codon:yes stop_codon:yes gene_type:complete